MERANLSGMDTFWESNMKIIMFLVLQDNVQIQHVMASFLPGHQFTAGRHHVLYTATDADGNKARCGFTITIKQRSQNQGGHTYYGGSYYANGGSRYTGGRFDHRRHHSTTRRPTLTQAPTPILPSPLGSVSGNSNGNINYHNVPTKCYEPPKVENGKMHCANTAIGRKCTPICDTGFEFYQKFTSRPPSYVCNAHRVDWELRRFVPDCSPVRTNVDTCPAGWESRGNGRCVACPPGMHRTPRDRLCQLCPKGFFSDVFSAPLCQRCPMSHTTRGLGSRVDKHCYYHRASSGLTNAKNGAGRLPKKNRLGFMFYNRWSSGARNRTRSRN